MNKFFYILAFNCCMVSMGLSQYSNPFEIRHRLDSIYMQSGSGESLTDVQNIPGLSQDSITSDMNIALIENPFDVDHVPVRKSELRKTSVVSPRMDTDVSAPDKQGSGLVIFGLSLLSLLLIAVVATVKRNIFSKVFKSFTNDNLLKLTQREENNGLNGGFLLLYIVFAINGATFIYLLIKGSSFSSAPSWLLVLLAVVVIYLIRHIAMFFLGVIFPVQREASQYSFLIAVVNILLGLLLLPFNLLIAYAPDFISVSSVYIILGVIAFLFIIRMIKGFLLGLINYGTNVFHFFLYLCTFEIAPALLIFRFFSNMGV
ncbi:MAG: DUF4271 domain-containing protein [Saprospiraceae bacterium]|nr:DUF4271 domain-containing protein [Saprospiraceae bacterium]